MYVERIQGEFEKGTKPRVSPKYTQIRHQKRLAERADNIPLVKKLHAELLNTEYTLHNDPEYKRLRYIRYADD